MEKILVVDDNEQNCELMRDILLAWGYEVYEAFQGMDAIRYALSYQPDIILLDVMLPGMNGFEVCHEIKTNPRVQHIPIIMLTVLNDVEDRIRGLKVGADHFLSKPINYNELKYRISALIHHKKQLDRMEYQQRVVEVFLAMMKASNLELYLHSCQVHEYCHKVSRLLFIGDQQYGRLLIGAYLHDIGKLIAEGDHLEIGASVVAPLKMGDWLGDLIRNHHNKESISPDYALAVELEILTTVNRFVNLSGQARDKESCLVGMYDEISKGWWSARVVEALQQLLKDEKFIKTLSVNN